MSVLISSCSSFCHCTLQISPLPVTIGLIRSGYFSWCFFCFLTVALAVLCKKLTISFLSFSDLTGSAVMSSTLMHITCSFVHFVRVSNVLPVQNHCGFMHFTKLCFVLFCHSLWTNIRRQQISFTVALLKRFSDLQLKGLSSPLYEKVVAVMFMMTIKPLKM